MSDVRKLLFPSYIFEKIAIFTLLYLLLNLPFLVISLLVHFDRPIFNIDIILLAVSAFYFKRFYLLSILFLFFEVVLYILEIYPFLTISDILYLFQFIKETPFFYQLHVIVLLFAFVTLCATAFRILNYKKLTTIFLIFCYFFIYSKQNQKLFFSPFHYIYTNLDLNRMIIRNTFTNTIEKNPYDSLYKVIKQSNNQNILLIINESWGMTKDHTLYNKVISPLTQNKKYIKNFHSGEYFFIGGTGIAEFRELCNFRPANINIQKTTSFPTDAKKCLPHYFKNKKYNTISIHGAKLNLYDRAYWYPLAGFQQSYHLENLKHLKTCGVFNGVCDNEIIQHKLIPLLNNKHRNFIHFVTLDTHAPYRKILTANHLNCNINLDSCKNLNLQYEFFQHLSKALPRIKNTAIYIIGDHQPPISSKSEAKQFFKEDIIPWIYFRTGT